MFLGFENGTNIVLPVAADNSGNSQVAVMLMQGPGFDVDKVD